MLPLLICFLMIAGLTFAIRLFTLIFYLVANNGLHDELTTGSLIVSFAEHTLSLIGIVWAICYILNHP